MIQIVWKQKSVCVRSSLYLYIFLAGRVLVAKMVVWKSPEMAVTGSISGLDHFFNPLPHMAFLGSSNSVANKDMMSKIWVNGDTVFFWLSRKHCGKRRNLPFPQCFQKLLLLMRPMSIYGVKGLPFTTQSRLLTRFWRTLWEKEKMLVF